MRCPRTDRNLSASTSRLFISITVAVTVVLTLVCGPGNTLTAAAPPTSQVQTRLAQLGPRRPAFNPGRTAAPKTASKPVAAPTWETRVAWKRDGRGRIEVTGSRTGTRLSEATKALQAAADRLDCLRTHKPHVRWSRLVWTDGRISGVAVADSGVHGNVALLALRDLMPGRSTFGSGVQQIRGRKDRASFRVRILVAAARR